MGLSQNSLINIEPRIFPATLFLKDEFFFKFLSILLIYIKGNIGHRKAQRAVSLESVEVGKAKNMLEKRHNAWDYCARLVFDGTYENIDLDGLEGENLLLT